MNENLTSHKPYLVNAYKNWLESNGFGVIMEVYVNNTNVVIPSIYLKGDVDKIEIDISLDVVTDFTFCGESFRFYKKIKGVSREFTIPCDLVTQLSIRGAKDKDSGAIKFPYEDLIKNHKKTIDYRPKLEIVR